MNPIKFCKTIPLPYAICCSIIPLGLFFLYRQSRPLPCPPLPGIPEAAAEAPAEETPPKPPTPKPKRDPFRPLNHPVPAQPVKVPGLAKALGSINSNQMGPVQKAGSQRYRLCGIVTMNGRSKALLRTSSGSLLLGPGEVLPGIGTIETIEPSGLVCAGKRLAVGEVWQ